MRGSGEGDEGKEKDIWAGVIPIRKPKVRFESNTECLSIWKQIEFDSFTIAPMRRG